MEKAMLFENAIIINCKRPQKIEYLKNGVPIYCGIPVNLSKDIIEIAMEKIENNLNQINTIDDMAKQKGDILGRFVITPVGNGKAYYQIIGVSRYTVKIKLVDNIGDDYMIPSWGKETVIDKEFAISNIKHRNKQKRFFDF